MARKTPAQVAAKYARRGSEALPDYLQGIDNVTESPMEKAIIKLPKAKQNYIKAIDSGKMERGLKRVSLTDWKNVTKQKGEERYVSGIVAAQPKMESFMGELLPHIDGAKDKIKNMPDTTLQQNLERSRVFLTEMSKFKRTK